MPMQYEIRPISSKEFGEFSETTARAFGIDQDAIFIYEEILFRFR